VLDSDENSSNYRLEKRFSLRFSFNSFISCLSPFILFSDFFSSSYFLDFFNDYFFLVLSLFLFIEMALLELLQGIIIW